MSSMPAKRRIAVIVALIIFILVTSTVAISYPDSAFLASFKNTFRDGVALLATNDDQPPWARSGGHALTPIPSPTCAPPPTDMVAWWPGEGNADDIKGPPFENATLMNHATYAPGKVGQAFSFDGVDDYVEVPNSSTLDLTNGLTLQVWLYQRSSGYGTLFSKSDNFGAQPTTSYGLGVAPDGSFFASLYGPSLLDSFATGPGVVSPGQWYHISFTWDGTIGPTDNVKLYVNGTLAQAWTKGPNPLNVTAQSVTLGAMKPPYYFNRLNGLLDEPQIFSRALTAAEVQSAYNAGSAGICRPACTPLPQNSVSWWTGNGTANDIVGANNGVLHGAGYTTGKVGEAFDFSGSNDHLQVASPAGLPTGAAPRTMMLWFRTPGTWGDTYPLMMQYGGTSASSKFGLMAVDSGGRKLYFWGESNDMPGTTVLQTNTWYHGAVTYDGSRVRLYLNGQLEAEQIKSLNTYGGSDFTIGRHGTDSQITGEWNGLIDDAVIFDRELSQSEIQTIFDAGSAGMCPPTPTPTPTLTPTPTPAVTYGITYDGNGNTGGTAPVDAHSPYNAGSWVGILGPGDLAQNGSVFSGWNTSAAGTGTRYTPAQAFIINSGTTLYAQWTPALCEPAGLDPPFGTNGIVTTDYPDHHDHATAAALQPDGKIIAAGQTFTIGVGSDFALVRYNVDGSLDATFGSAGKVTTNFMGGFADAMALQADGKIVVAGSGFNGSNGDYAVIRYNSDGSLDTSFGTGGKVSTAILAGNDQPRSVLIQPDGKIVVAGYADNGSNDDFAVVRYNDNGSLDSSFGTGGKVTTDVLGSTDQALSAALQPDGGIVLGGYSYGGSTFRFAVVRYDSSGALDPLFGTGGKVTTSVLGVNDFASSIGVQPDGKIVLLGSAQNGGPNFDFAIVRYNGDGSLDPAFGVGGKVWTGVLSSDDFAHAVALQPDGKIVAVGEVYDGPRMDFAVVRYNADGTLDSLFGAGGRVTTVVNGIYDSAQSVVIQPDGRIVAVGYTDSGYNDDFALVRYGVACATPTPTPTPTETPTATPTPTPTTIVQFTALNYSGDESRTAQVLVTRTGDTSGTTDVTFDTIPGGTATAGSDCSGGADYVSVTGHNVHFAGGDIFQQVDIPLCVEKFIDPSETIKVQLSNPSAPAELGTPVLATVTVNDTAAEFRAPSEVWFNASSTSIYPSEIVVSGAPNTITDLRVTLYDLWAVSPQNLEALLVGPQGQKFVLMADCAGTTWGGPATLTFEDWAPNFMDQTSTLGTGVFKPTTWVAPVGNFPSPAPAGPYAEPGWTAGGATLSSTFAATNPNGTWSLYLYYVATGTLRRAPTPTSAGSIAAGWGIQFQFLAPTAANVGISGRVLTADGVAIRKARVTLDDSSGHKLSAISNSFGYYHIDGVHAGGDYLITAAARGYTFAPRVLSVRDELNGIDLRALP